MEYTRITYPDGQISAKIIALGNHHVIKERINNYEDLFFIKSLKDAIDSEARELGDKPQVDLVIPCMFGQRSDRRFTQAQSFDLKIITDFINSCNFNSVSVLDPHSDTTLALLDRSFKLDSAGYVKESLYNIDKAFGDTDEKVTLVSPDAGSYKKVFSYGEEFETPVVAAVKHRDLKGNISLKFMGDVKDKDCLIVDDLCDGGYTFILLAKELRQQGAKKVYLYISHAYFSKGLEVFDGLIDHIFCTNSVKNIEHPLITQY